jgi:DNA-binding beta-propeller fold protein YncE
MKHLAILLLAAPAVLMPGRARTQEAEPLRLVQTMALSNVQGRIDHLAVDLKGQRLFVAALGNDSVEVIDLRSGKRVRSLTGFREPQGVAFIESPAKLFVSNGGTGALDIFGGDTLRLLGVVKFPTDADNLRYDASVGQLFIGYGNGSLGVMDAKEGKLLGAVKLAAHPESFQMETAGTKIFVNVPGADHVAVVDRATLRVVTTWPLQNVRANFPMALDEANHGLFVGARQPAKLIVFDTQSGKVVTSLDCAGDADDLFYDRERKRIYLSGGEGFVDVFAQHDANHYRRVARLATAPGARTSLWVPQVSRLYVAVPHRRAQGAEVRAYDALP